MYLTSVNDYLWDATNTTVDEEKTLTMQKKPFIMIAHGHIVKSLKAMDYSKKWQSHNYRANILNNAQV